MKAYFAINFYEDSRNRHKFEQISAMLANYEVETI